MLSVGFGESESQRFGDTGDSEGVKIRELEIWRFREWGAGVRLRVRIDGRDLLVLDSDVGGVTSACVCLLVLS